MGVYSHLLVLRLHLQSSILLEKDDYKDLKDTLIRNGIKIEKELTWGNETLKSIYFRDPAGNLVEFITKGNWPVED
jgi:catechol 2,3-dioxygenase-like lactoylglutathione lyase family enzyme